MNNDYKGPELSVVIASYNSEKTIEECLKSLEKQETDKDFEIVVVDSSSREDAAMIIKDKFPRVNLYRFSQRKFCGEARNFGISKSQGKIIAFIDADCTADINWVSQIISNHSCAYPAIGGAIANGNPQSRVGWAAYFTEYSQWMPAEGVNWRKDIAGSNMSYKREAFENYGSFIHNTYSSDTEFHWRLTKDGQRLRFSPLILVFHHNITDLNLFLLHEYHHGRDFARVRVKAQGFSELKRFSYAVGSCFIPIKIFIDIAIRNLKNRMYLKHFLKTLPILMLGILYWSFGEFISYVNVRKRLVKK